MGAMLLKMQTGQQIMVGCRELLYESVSPLSASLGFMRSAQLVSDEALQKGVFCWLLTYVEL